MDNYKIAVKVSIVTIVINIVLSIFKIGAGIFGNSNAIVADGIHTLSDVLTTVVVLVGIKIASKEADHNHPYGHEKYESVFAKILSILLFVTGAFIGYESLLKLINKEFTVPGNIALVAAVASIVIKEAMYWYTIKNAKKIKSTSMEADAWHHRSDALSSVGTFVGVIGAKMGFPALDPLAGVVVSILVVKVGLDLYLKSISELVDESASDEVLENIENITRSVDGVIGISSLKTRVSGNVMYADIEIYVDGELTVTSGHDIAEKVHDILEEKIDELKHIMVHVEPFKKNSKLQKNYKS